MAMALRLSSAPRSLVATMFWMVISGSWMVWKPLARSSLQTMPTAVWTSSMDLAPVQTTLPERKMRAAVLGSGTRKTRPGNCSGSYSALENVALMAFRSSSSPMEVEATTFWMWMTAMVGTARFRALQPTSAWYKRRKQRRKAPYILLKKAQNPLYDPIWRATGGARRRPHRLLVGHRLDPPGHRLLREPFLGAGRPHRRPDVPRLPLAPGPVPRHPRREGLGGPPQRPHPRRPRRLHLAPLAGRGVRHPLDPAGVRGGLAHGLPERALPLGLRLPELLHGHPLGPPRRPRAGQPLGAQLLHHLPSGHPVLHLLQRPGDERLHPRHEGAALQLRPRLLQLLDGARPPGQRLPQPAHRHPLGPHPRHLVDHAPPRLHPARLGAPPLPLVPHPQHGRLRLRHPLPRHPLGHRHPRRPPRGPAGRHPGRRVPEGLLRLHAQPGEAPVRLGQAGVAQAAGAGDCGAPCPLGTGPPFSR